MPCGHRLLAHSGRTIACIVGSESVKAYLEFLYQKKQL